MMKCVKRSFLAILLVLVLSSCSVVGLNQKPVAQATAIPPGPPPLYSLRSLAQAQGMLIGAAVNTQAFQTDVVYRNTLASEFNYITPETSMEFLYLHPSPNVYDFHVPDSFLAFAQAHNMQMRGHTLIWPHENNTLPDWITQGKFSSSQLKTILHDYITTVVSHYRGKVDVWDVLNEAMNFDGTLVDCPWLQLLGPGYVDLIFRWAHEADPNAQLYYNDYLAENMGTKSTLVYNMIKGMRQRGVPISGVGFEMHINGDASPDYPAMLKNMKRLDALGVGVSITEMDVRTFGSPGTRAQQLATQAQIYHNVLTVCLMAKNCKRFTSWGFTDRYSWITGYSGHADVPLIFDPFYRPKPAYYAMVSAFTENSMHLLRFM